MGCLLYFAVEDYQEKRGGVVKRFIRYIVMGVLALSVALAVTSSFTIADATAKSEMQVVSMSVAPVPDPTPTTSVVAEPGIIEQFGPPGVIITTVLTGILMIVKAVNEGKKIDVTTYKERAADAETRSNAEIGKVHKKLAELEKKLDDVIADRDEYRDALEERKAHFTQQILDMEKRHQRELEDMHAALMIEVHVRHRLERLLVQNGIQVPDTPPPYTKSMKESVTPQDARDAKLSTASMKIIREERE